MTQHFIPETNKVYFINKCTMLIILRGNGPVQVDFRDYFDWSDKVIFLDKGQYIKFLNKGFSVRKIEFDDQEIFQRQEVRVLFKHLVSLGYITLQDCADCQRLLEDSLSAREIIDISTGQWFWQNPFRADEEEYQVIFDVKEVIDTHFREHFSFAPLLKHIDHPALSIHEIYSQKIGITARKLLREKRLTEAKKDIVFTDQSIKEISFSYGYRDPANFTHQFRTNTGLTPVEFRDQSKWDHGDSFSARLLQLVGEYHTQERSLNFYADQLNMSVKSISRKTREAMNTSLGQLLRQELIRTASQQLREGKPVVEVAVNLGFEEPHHFSAFFKHYTGLRPGDYLEQTHKT